MILKADFEYNYNQIKTIKISSIKIYSSEIETSFKNSFINHNYNKIELFSNLSLYYYFKLTV